VRSLPGNIRRIFAEDFMPAVLEEVGCSATPWQNLNLNLLQGCVDLVYPGLDYVAETSDALDLSARARVMSFRNTIASNAVTSVQAFMMKFKTPELAEGYVKSGLIYYGEIPFIYRMFEPTAIRSSNERGGYQVTRHGLFQSQAILDTMLIYYGKQGVKQYLPTTFSPGNSPVGALALVCTAIERALLMHSTGYFIKDKRSYSEKFWGQRTAIYVKLAKEMSASQWNNLYAAIRFAGGVQDKLEEFSKPVQHWTDDPDEYFIMGSDPAEAE